MALDWTGLDCTSSITYCDVVYDLFVRVRREESESDGKKEKKRFPST